jgi:hypothetical protein
MELIMTLNEFETLTLIETETSTEKDDEFSIPLDISDIISICKDFNSLGWQIQNQVENILEVGVEESIRSGNVKQESLPHIKFFLRKICDNAYFGDAVSQAKDCIYLIQEYEEQHQVKRASNYN